MILKQLELKQFRNIHECTLGFYNGIHVLYGANGHGKTNLLESIYYIAISKSFRPVTEKQIVEQGKDSFEVKAVFQKEEDEYFIRAYWDKIHKKNFWINKHKIQTIQEYIGLIPIVLLIPDDLLITRGAPSFRRKFMDLVLSQSDKKYLKTLMQYQRMLRHRNALFQQEEIDSTLAESITIQLAKFAYIITSQRLQFIEWLKKNLTPLYTSISKGMDEVKIHYISTFQNVLGMEENQFIQYWLKKLPEELQRQKTIVGTHLDDFVIYLNGKSIRYYGSQGENKTMVIALKIAEYKYLQSSREEKPILLFDDIFGELDPQRIQNMLLLMGNIGQVFVTTASRELFHNITVPYDVHFYNIVQGQAVEERE